MAEGQDAPQREDDPRDTRIKHQDREISRLRGDLAQVNRDRDRWKRHSERLQQQLDTARRAGFRQAAPFAKDRPQGRGGRPGRRAGARYGRQACRRRPAQVDETHAAPVPAACPDCGGAIEVTRVTHRHRWTTPSGDYRDFEVVAKKVERFNQLTSERERLFSGERLWLRFSTFCQAHGRMAMLAQFSFEKGTYVDWRTDDHMNKILSAILPPDVLKRTTMMKAGGFRETTGHLKAEFLKEAIRVMSGSQHVADSLSDLQSTLLSEQQKLTPDGPQRDAM